MKIKIYGCRGSTPVSHTNSRYGGNTSCMTVESDGNLLILDAGSGLTNLQYELMNTENFYDTTFFILLSHLHLDHIVGLGTFNPIWRKSNPASVFTCNRNDKPLKEQVFGLFSPPYWPADMKKSTAEIVAIEPGVSFKINNFTVTPFAAKHPDKTLSFHVTDGKKNFVHLLDNETATMQPDVYNELVNYCKDADIIIFDAAYSSEDYEKHVNWGHSTVKHGVELAQKCNCKQMLFSHLGQQYTDSDLDGWKKHFDKDIYMISYDGLELEI